MQIPWLTYVLLVPPVYYADQACERAKLHIREGDDGTQILGQVHENLKYAMVSCWESHPALMWTIH